eukprot:COSAG02_NODE_7678_length_2897_cov_10.541722_1_plen_109_part_00
MCETWHAMSGRVREGAAGTGVADLLHIWLFEQLMRDLDHLVRIGLDDLPRFHKPIDKVDLLLQLLTSLFLVLGASFDHVLQCLAQSRQSFLVVPVLVDFHLRHDALHC